MTSGQDKAGGAEGEPSVAACVAQVDALANAFKGSQVLFVAHQAGLFAFLQDPHSPQEVAKALNWSPRGTMHMLQALLALALLERVGDTFQNSAIARTCLTSQGAAYLGDFLEHTMHAHHAWLCLDEVVQTGKGRYVGRHPQGSAGERAYVAGMDALARLSAPAVVAAVQPWRYLRLLDVGCGCGAYSVAFLQANDNLEAVLLDGETAVVHARTRMQRLGLDARCRYQIGSCFDAPWGEGYDLIFISNLMHGLGASECQLLFQRAYAALVPTGRICIKDFLESELEDDDEIFLSLFSLHMMLHSREGRTWSASLLEEWATEAGLQPMGVEAVGRKGRLFWAEKLS